MQPVSKQILQAIVLVMLLAFGTSVGAISVEAQRALPSTDRVVIQRRRIVLTRSPRIARQFPERKTALVSYPIISGLRNAAALRRVQAALSFKNIFDYSLDDYKNDAWLSEFNYVVNYNRDYMLDLTFTQSGMGAYPDDHEKHFLFDLRNGHLVTASDVFKSEKLAVLATLVDHELQSEIKRLEKENAESNEADADQKESISGAYENLKFEAKNLDDFMVGPKGITFLYDAGFPHVIQALEPEGRYFFSYAALKDYIKSDGLLGLRKG